MSPTLRTLCVYCGSSAGASEIYADAARGLARALVDRKMALVYGGGRVGLMGVIADEVLRLGGEVTGVIPKALMEREVGHHGLTAQHIVRDMHERKALMAELSDGFIAMPGGIGTLEELFEVLTWAQLGYHAKPIGLLNVDGFYDGLIEFTGHLVLQEFLKPAHAALLMHDTCATTLLDRFADFSPTAEAALDPGAARQLLP